MRSLIDPGVPAPPPQIHRRVQFMVRPYPHQGLDFSAMAGMLVECFWHRTPLHLEDDLTRVYFVTSVEHGRKAGIMRFTLESHS